jgi:hypothetical protein
VGPAPFVGAALAARARDPVVADRLRTEAAR